MFMAKWANVTLKAIGRPASYFPGKIAVSICPNFIGMIDKPDKIIAVTGTNGKTTVCNMLIDAFTSQGYNILNNKYGSNINAGIATSLISGCNIRGKSKSPENPNGSLEKIAILEIDERSSIKVYTYMEPNMLVITNIFRDSYKRNPHPEYIVDLINKKLSKDTKIFLDSDDLRACTIGEEIDHITGICKSKGNEKIFYGISANSDKCKEVKNIIQDEVFCPKCGSKLKYEYKRYHHIGKAHCTKCDFESPLPKYEIVEMNDKEIVVRINKNASTKLIEKPSEPKEQNKSYKFKAASNNIINIYDEVAVIAVLSEFGFTIDKIKEMVDKFKVVSSRYKEEKYKDKSIIMQLAKGQNPVACSRVFEYINEEKGNKAVMLNLDDKFDAKAHDENIAWIYDVDYEFLNSDDIKQIIVGGVRREDHKLRLLLAGVPEEKIVTVEKEINGPKEIKDLKNIDKIFILYDVYTVDTAEKVKEEIKKII